MDYFLLGFRNYADFSSRASRPEYWYFFLFNFIIAIILATLDTVMGSGSRAEMGILSQVYAVCIFLPSLALCVRRLHDIGKSGWMALVSLIPLIGPIWLLIMLVTAGDAGNNEYGKPSMQ